MKKKTVSLTIEKKMNAWLKTLPDGIRNEIRDSIIVTGGCIVSLLTQTKVNDFDVYLNNPISLLRLMNHYLGKLKGHNAVVQVLQDKTLPIHQQWVIANEDILTELINADKEIRLRYFIKSAGIVRLPKPGKASQYLPQVVTDNALSLTGQIQIINRFHGTSAQIHENFDFVHVTSYWTFREKLVLPATALEAILTKELRYFGSLYPIASIIRVRKFVQRGWTINAGQLVKMAMQVSKLDLSNIDILRDQLIGVDLSYFESFLAKVEEKTKELGTLSPGYLFELLDEVFDSNEDGSTENEGSTDPDIDID